MTPPTEPLPATAPPSPWSTAASTPRTAASTPDLRDALEKLQLNDASLTFEPETSVALGFGFRCGFLGMLHMEIIQERLEREFNLDLVTTLPSVIYHVYKSDGTMVKVDNPPQLPRPRLHRAGGGALCEGVHHRPNEFVGNIMPMCQERRGEFKDMQYLDTHLVELHYQMPLNEIIYDFFDTLKANTKGYASLDYELSGYRTSDLVKVDLLLNGDGVDALSFIAHRDKAYPRARRLCEKLKENIPPPAVRGAHPGGHRRPHHRPGNGEGHAQGRAGQVLRRRYHPQEEAAGKAEGRQKEDAESGHGAGSHRGLHGRPQAGQRLIHPHRPNGSAPFGRTHLTFGKVHDMSELYELLTLKLLASAIRS